jgi:hypothetical protein
MGKTTASARLSTCRSSRSGEPDPHTTTLVASQALASWNLGMNAGSVKYALEPTGFDLLVDSDGCDPLWCKSPNVPQML